MWREEKLHAQAFSSNDIEHLFQRPLLLILCYWRAQSPLNLRDVDLHFQKLNDVLQRLFLKK